MIPKFGEAAVQLTFSGLDGVVWNGVPDLVNEGKRRQTLSRVTTDGRVLSAEFVLKRDSAIWWQASGEKIAFASYDNSYVDRLPVVSNAPAFDADSDEASPFSHVFPSVVSYPYARPGRRVAITTLFVADASKLTSKPVTQVTSPREIQLA